VSVGQSKHHREKGWASSSVPSAAGARSEAVARAQEEAAGAEQAEGEVEVSQGDFWAALRELRPSLSLEELARYSALQRQYESR